MQLKINAIAADRSMFTRVLLCLINRNDDTVTPSASRWRINKTAGNLFFNFKLLSDVSCFHYNRKYHRTTLCFFVDIIRKSVTKLAL